MNEAERHIQEMKMLAVMGICVFFLLVICYGEWLEWRRGEGKWFGKKPHRPRLWL